MADENGFWRGESAVVSLRRSGRAAPRPTRGHARRFRMARPWARHYRRFRPRCGADAVGRLSAGPGPDL